MGFPLVEAWFGPEPVVYAMIYDQLGTFPLLASYGAIILATYAHGERPGPLGIAKRILVFPPFVALLAGLALHGVVWPEAISGLLERVGNSLMPVVMLAVGLQLEPRLSRDLWAPMGLGLGLKLLAAPLLFGLVGAAMGLAGIGFEVSVFEAGMGSMITAGALAASAGLAPRLAAAMVGVSIPLSFVTLPLIHALFVAR
ncbi:putative Auxin Efflux Carrier [Magnetofaba australis IT-1]|uniref:Putative Auxin Efflux Carrier n=1 Tax=Magnetofaba australis IT-1 TaxID=1434232 RepID=A0A1Y2K574_9PROT|nr:putative Auxin Efflux Carrier [Magnetofaba australis IT-1]